MSKSSLKCLKLYQEQLPAAGQPDIESVASLPEMLAAFREVTGWSLEFCGGTKPIHPTEHAWSAPVTPGVGAPLGPATLGPARSASAAMETSSAPRAARRLGAAVGAMLGELSATRQALWEREAELAAGVPVAGRPANQQHLAARLEAVLKGGAQAIGCQSAGLYLLDEATTSLKLRSSWGLPPQRLLAPPRPLRGAVADLEAMLGHAVVLEDAQLLDHWQPPEKVLSAACVPVSTPTTVLGTLWAYSRAKRDFSESQTNILEMAAGRVAAELEREILLKEGTHAAQMKRQFAALERTQRNQLPSHAPLLDGWELAGWSSQDALRGDFYDWFCLRDGLVGAVLGDCVERGIVASLSAGALRTSVRSHGQYHRNPASVLNRVNLSLWTASAGDQATSLFYGLIDTRSDQLRCASAGDMGIIHLRSRRWRSTIRNTPPLGAGPETRYSPFSGRLEPGDVLMVVSKCCAETTKQTKLQQGLAEALKSQLTLPAKDLILVAQDYLEANTDSTDGGGGSVLVIKRSHS